MVVPSLPTSILALVCLATQASAFSSIRAQPGAAQKFIVFDQDQVHYPYTVHLPDRTTRNLPPLTTPPPLLLSLSGSGARGPADKAASLSGYDGASRKISFYNLGNRTTAHCVAAEEFLTVVPVAPIESAQADANWNVTALIPILTKVATEYEVDLTRVYLSTYSMGSRAAWYLLMDNPDIFAGVVISSGKSTSPPEKLEKLLGIPIMNYIGQEDEPGLDVLTEKLSQDYAQAMSNARSAGVKFNETRQLENHLAIPGADHLKMTNRPWDVDVDTHGYQGALSWLLTQVRPEGANIPGLENAGYASLAAAASGGSAITATGASTPASATNAALPSSGLAQPFDVKPSGQTGSSAPTLSTSTAKKIVACIFTLLLLR